MFSTEPKVQTSNTWDFSYKARGAVRGKSLRNIKREYNRKFRRTRHEEAAQELADYQAHGAY